MPLKAQGRAPAAARSTAPADRPSAQRSSEPAELRPVLQSPDTLTEQAYRQIEEMIVVLQLRPGDMLSEQSLSASLKIGRTPIREALQRLAIEGLVRILPRKGILVSEINPREQLLVLEVRRELERLLCRVGSERADDAQRARLREIAEAMDDAGKRNDGLAFMRLDRELNSLIIEAGHNDYAARAMKLFSGLSRRFWYVHYKRAADLPLCARLHAEQARTVARGQPVAAAKACDALLDYVESFTRGTVLL